MFCPKCGGEYREGITRCYDCGVELEVDEPARAPRARRRLPWVAAALSLLVSGLGQLYARRPWRAAIVFLVQVALVLALAFTTLWFVGLVAMILGSLLYRAWAAFDAWKCAARSELEPTAWYNRWYLYGVLVILAYLADPTLSRLVPTQSMYIPAASMEPALRVGDRVMVQKLRRPSRQLSLGEVVMFRAPERPEVSMVKRAAALPGHKLEIVGKRVFLDGKEVDDSHAVFADKTVYPPDGQLGIRDHFGPYVVSAGKVFLLGDNRDQSYDSRYFGPVPIESVTGRVLYVYWSRETRRIGRPVR